MKNWILNLTKACILIAGILIIQIYSGCTPEEFKDGLGPVPTSDMVKFSATPTTDNPNIVSFENETPGTITAMWDLGNGENGTGETINGSYAVAGDYTVTLTVFTAGGYATNTQTVHIDETNVSMLDRDDYNFLTGGADALNGKTWVIDKDTAGHLGVGDITVPDKGSQWWAAQPNEKAGVGLYDDEMVFNLNGFAYTYNNNGDTYANHSDAPGIGGTDDGTNDVTVTYTPPSGMTWSITEEDGKNYLNISKNGFIGYYVGVSKYQILTLDENHLYLMSTDKAAAGNGWWYRLVPKGYVHPVVEKPFKSADLYDNFDTEGNIDWITQNVVFQRSYDNPAPLPVGTQSKVGLYGKQEGDANQYANIQTVLPYRMDLSQRHKFKVKVYFPGYNDYTKVKQQVSVKLQNSLLGGNAWTTQKEIIQPVPVTDQWVELEFDFSDVASSTVFDQIVLQFGGEAHPNPGIFYISDFELEE